MIDRASDLCLKKWINSTVLKGVKITKPPNLLERKYKDSIVAFGTLNDLQDIRDEVQLAQEQGNGIKIKNDIKINRLM